jgi:sodium-dependent dicarboxylate transporter 2/3/5
VSDPGGPDRFEHPHELPDSILGWLELSSPRRLGLFTAITAIAWFGVDLLPATAELEPEARRALFILLLAVGLWLTETIPAFAVSILVIALDVLLIGAPASGAPGWDASMLMIGHPLIWLFFGGLMLAAGMREAGVDRWLATHALTRFAHRPAALVVAVASISFLLSMVMSNTATSAMMLALVGPLVATRPQEDRFAATLVLAVPAGANLGGMGSLVGTPPNAIAAALLAEQAGREISFARWFGIGLPPAVILAAALITLLVLRIPRDTATADAALVALPAAPPAPRWEVLVVTLTLASTFGLWLTQDLHGLPTPVVAVVPVVLFTATGVLSVDAFRSLSWDVLFLLAGGLVLGQMLVDTGLADWLVGGSAARDLGPLAFTFAAGVAAVILSNVMSNTAAANVLVPLVLSAGAAAVGAGAGSSGTTAALAVALCASTAMALPVATPPNALAYASGRLRTRDFLLLGGVAGVLGPLVVTAWLTWITSL